MKRMTVSEIRKAHLDLLIFSLICILVGLFLSTCTLIFSTPVELKMICGNFSALKSYSLGNVKFPRGFFCLC